MLVCFGRIEIAFRLVNGVPQKFAGMEKYCLGSLYRGKISEKIFLISTASYFEWNNIDINAIF